MSFYPSTYNVVYMYVIAMSKMYMVALSKQADKFVNLNIFILCNATAVQLKWTMILRF